MTVYEQKRALAGEVDRLRRLLASVEAERDEAKRCSLSYETTAHMATRERDAARAALRDLPCMFVWRAAFQGGGVVRACDMMAADLPDLPEHSWCPNCRTRAALARAADPGNKSNEEG